MDPSAQTWAIGVSLGALGLALGGLFVRGIGQYLRTRQRLQLFWAGGMGLAAGAMAIETVVYAGVVSSGLLQAYVFLTAALVGVLSLGATRVLKRPRFESGYRGFIFASTVPGAYGSWSWDRARGCGTARRRFTSPMKSSTIPMNSA